MAIRFEYRIRIYIVNLIKMYLLIHPKKQPPTVVLKKRCSENMQQIYRRTPMPKRDFNKVKQLY